MEAIVSLRELRAARMTRNIFGLIAIGAVASTALLALELGKRDNTVVLVPTVIPEGTVAHGGVIDGRYLEGVARDALYSLLNVSPETTDYARDAIARVSAPYARAEILTLWDDIIEEVRKRDISTVFVPRSLDVSEIDMVVTIEGELSTYLGSTRTSRERKKYRITFGVVNASARIARIEELEIAS